MGMALPLSCTLAGMQTGTTLAPASLSAYCCSQGMTCAFALYLRTCMHGSTSAAVLESCELCKWAPCTGHATEQVRVVRLTA